MTDRPSTPYQTKTPLLTEMLQLARHWLLAVVIGAVLVLLGCAAILAPQVASLAVTTVLGVLLLLSGLVVGVQVMGARSERGFWLMLLSAVLYAGLGGFMLTRPEQGSNAVAFIIGAFFLLQGGSTVAHGMRERPERAWLWRVIGGGLAAALGAAILVILLRVPASASDVIAVFVGIELILNGTLTVLAALYAKRAAPDLKRERDSYRTKVAALKGVEPSSDARPHAGDTDDHDGGDGTNTNANADGDGKPSPTGDDDPRADGPSAPTTPS